MQEPDKKELYRLMREWVWKMIPSAETAFPDNARSEEKAVQDFIDGIMRRQQGWIALVDAEPALKSRIDVACTDGVTTIVDQVWNGRGTTWREPIKYWRYHQPLKHPDSQ